MEEQPVAHRSVQATPMKTTADQANPAVKLDPNYDLKDDLRSDAVRVAKAKLSRRRSLQQQRNAQKS